RSEVRPHAGRSFPSRGHLPALAARQAAARLPLRSARSHQALRIGEDLLVRIERLLSRPQIFGNVFEVDADAGPGAVSTAHGIDENIGGLQVHGGVWMSRLPAFESCKCICFVTSAADLNQRLR